MIVLRRLYSRGSYVAKYVSKSKTDPGIRRQKKLLEVDEADDNMDPEDLEEMESDFMSVHKSHKEHLAEIEARQEKEKYSIVKQKYFKEKFPNFLTWHDKEQIRYLYNSNPEEWSVEKLSESFPALPDVIEKIIKSKWAKTNETKVSNHDKGVQQNWKDFKQGKMNDLPQDLKEHLQKFSNRTLNFKPSLKKDIKEITVHSECDAKTSKGEFSEIIVSYQKLKEEKAEKQEVNRSRLECNSSAKNNDTKFKSGPNIKLMTFKQLQETVDRKIERGANLSIEDKLLKEAIFPKKEDNITVELKHADISNIVEHRHETNNNKLGFVRKTTRDMSHLIYPQKIIIPQELYKKGCTYKLNDCYYDSDGEFLYRVPGMS